MLVVISDLHFVDGTAGEHDVPPRAFETVFLSHIETLAKRNNVKKIKILLLGDIIDLLRTTKWLEIDPDDRPWGKNGLRDAIEFDPLVGSRTEQKCYEILSDIIRRNCRTFRLFRKLKKKLGDHGVGDVQIIYLPGNHDRLVNIYPRIRCLTQKILGIAVNGGTVDGFSENNWHFRNAYADKEHSVFARHGHEFDPVNYGCCDKDSLIGHSRVPIGDVITTEIAVKIASLLLHILDELPESDEREEIKQIIFGLDNIRPWTSIPGYLVSKLKGNEVMRVGVKRALLTTLGSFLRIPLVREWLWNNKSRAIRQVWSCVQGAWSPWVSDTSSKDRYATSAYQDYVEGEDTFRFVVYGHTHSQEEIPLDLQGEKESFYINTGTWRSVIEPTLQGKDYASFKTMTYAVFYKSGERRADLFDIWTGHRNMR